MRGAGPMLNILVLLWAAGVAVPTFAHDLRGIREQNEHLSESEKRSLREAKADRDALATMLTSGQKSPALETVFRRSAAWKLGSTVTVCFMDGDDRARINVARVANEWAQHANLRFDFGSGNVRSCDVNAPSKIRVTFRTDGYWSYVGTDAVTIDKHRPTIGLSSLDRMSGEDPNFRFYVLHEFGHAIGLEHEHQSPRVSCNINLRVVQATYNWSEEQAKRNISQIKNSSAYYVSSYDPESVMHYALPKAFFGDQSLACVTRQPARLSRQDIAGISEIYPQSVSLSEEAPPNALPTMPISPSLKRILKRIQESSQ